MSIIFVSGNVFDAFKDYDVQAIGHGANCVGVMGAGVAASIANRFRHNYLEYRQRCLAKPRQFNPGDLFAWCSPEGHWVLNLATQDQPGPNAKLEYIEQALKKVVVWAGENSVERAAFPRIGAGIGGLDWDDVRQLMKCCFESSSLMVYVYEQYTPSRH